MKMVGGGGQWVGRLGGGKWWEFVQKWATSPPTLATRPNSRHHFRCNWAQSPLGLQNTKKRDLETKVAFFDLNFAETAINWNLILDVDFFFLSACKGEQLNDEIKSCQIVAIHR